MMTSARYKTPSYLPRFSFFVALCASLLIPGESLNCYECSNAQTNEECSRPDNLVDCKERSPRAMELDTCQTKLHYTDEHGVLISKKCVQGPCYLGDDQSAALGMQCDRSKPNWSCMMCCQEDGCNISQASSLGSSYIALGVATAVAVITQHHLLF